MNISALFAGVTAASLVVLGTAPVHAEPRTAGPMTGTSASAVAPPGPYSAQATALVSGGPSGKALVRIEGGTAYTKQSGKRSYKVFMPNGSRIRWVGEVNGKGFRAGSFSGRGLAKGWSRLGHRQGVGVVSTLMWSKGGELVLVSDPRVNAEGSLVVTARTGGPLPRKLPAFSLNINRAANTPRYPVYFDAVQLSGTLVAKASAGGDFSWTVVLGQKDSQGNVTPCTSSTNSGERPFAPNPHSFSGGYKQVYPFGPTTCGGVAFLKEGIASDGKTVPNSVALTWPSDATSVHQYDYNQILGTFVFAAGGVIFQTFLGQWAVTYNGDIACSVNGNVCPI